MFLSCVCLIGVKGFYSVVVREIQFGLLFSLGECGLLCLYGNNYLVRIQLRLICIVTCNSSNTISFPTPILEALY